MSRLLPWALLALVVGCKPKTPVADVAPTTTPAPDVTHAKSQEPEPPQCVDDRQCEGYLRCEEGACVVPPAVDGREVRGMPTATFERDGTELATFKLEIADDDWERTRGLMFRRKMHPDFGMLFVFDADAVRRFWMKNTLIPLDMVHVNAAGVVVGVVAEAEPMTLGPRETGEPARYVIELTAGRAAEVGIEKGARMIVTGLPAELAPR